MLLCRRVQSRGYSRSLICTFVIVLDYDLHVFNFNMFCFKFVFVFCVLFFVTEVDISYLHGDMVTFCKEHELFLNGKKTVFMRFSTRPLPYDSSLSLSWVTHVLRSYLRLSFWVWPLTTLLIGVAMLRRSVQKLTLGASSSADSGNFWGLTQLSWFILLTFSSTYSMALFFGAILHTPWDFLLCKKELFGIWRVSSWILAPRFLYKDSWRPLFKPLPCLYLVFIFITV